MGAIEITGMTKTYPAVRKGIIGFRDLLDDFRKKRSRVVACQNVDLVIGEGEILGLLGPNGAGKTTICKILEGVVTPTQGEVRVFGLDPARDGCRVHAFTVPVFGGETDIWGVFNQRLSCYENLLFNARLWNLPRTEIRARIGQALEAMGLDGLREQSFQKLSKGERQKLQIARALMIRPSLAIMDEPTLGVDIATRDYLVQTVRDVMNREWGATVLYTTHNLKEAEKICDRVAILNKQILALGTPSEICALAKERDVIESKFTVHTRTSVHEIRKKLGGLPCAELLSLEASESRGRFLIHLELECSNLTETIKNLVEIIQHGGGQVQEFQARNPSLEEAFLRISTRKGGIQ
jgi:ABC-2 type transport system ATP-binding protein